MASEAPFARVAKLALGLWMAGVIVAMFLVVPQYVGLGDAGRIIIMHVPTAWVTSVAFVASGIYSLRYLLKRGSNDDAHAVASAEVGFIFCVLATVTGAIFAQIAWGVFWNWDPRQTSIVVLLLIYAAYFALRSAIDEMDRKRRLAAAYNLFAAATMPFLLFVAPRIADSTLHPNCAFIPGSTCDGVTLELDGPKIGALGDNVLELQGIEQRGNLAVAQVQVSGPGNSDLGTLEPTYELTSNSVADRPQFAGEQYTLILERVDLEAGTVHLNIEAPGSGLLDNPRTLWTFFASTLGFTALFVWMYRLRAKILLLEEQITVREGTYGLAL